VEHSKTWPANKVKLVDDCINLLHRHSLLLNYWYIADNIVNIAEHQNTKCVFKG
jgi:hypothetical protein